MHIRRSCMLLCVIRVTRSLNYLGPRQSRQQILVNSVVESMVVAATVLDHGLKSFSGATEAYAEKFKQS